MENTPEAAPQNTGTEAPIINSNPAPEAPAQASVEAPATNDLGLTAEQAAEFKKFVEANGGFDKSFKTFKERISNPVQETPKTQEEPAAQASQPQAQEQPVHPQTPAGYMSQQEFMAQQYYNNLANMEAYAPIADKIRSGEMFSEMAKFGIRPMDSNGNINDVQVREFFDLYAKTIPTTPAQTPEASNAPTVDYINVKDGKIESMDQAARIIAQSATYEARGLAKHPDVEAAEAYMKEVLSGKKK